MVEDCPSCDSSKQLSLTLHDTLMTLNFKHCPAGATLLAAAQQPIIYFAMEPVGGMPKCNCSVYLDTL